MTEAEDLDHFDAALAADVDLLLVDEFSPDEIREAVRRTRAHRQHGGKTVIEYSGGATLETVRAIAACGVDHIRSDESRVGNERVSTCRSLWSSYHEKIQRIKEHQHPTTTPH